MLMLSLASSNLPAHAQAAEAQTGSPQERVADPATKKTLTVGVVRFILPHPKDTIISRTTQELRSKLGDRYTISVREFSLQEMDEVVCSAKVDLFISSSGFYRQMQRCGAKDLAASVSDWLPNANRSEGTAVVTLASSGLDSWKSLQGKRLVVSSREAFAGYLIPMREIARRGYDWEDFFGRTEIVGNVNHVPRVLGMLKEGKTDVVFLKQCLLEAYEAEHPQEKGLFQVVEPRQEYNRCRISSELYPAWVIASTKALETNLATEIAQILLAMPGDAHGVKWSVSTDFSHVDALHRDLRIGPYAYLREWTVRRFVETYWEWLAFFALFLVGLGVHSWRVSVLLKRNTRKLEATMSEREELQKQKAQTLAQLQSMQGLVAVNQMSSIVAHEMMTPLATMSLQLALLKDMLEDDKLEAGIMRSQIDKLIVQTNKAEQIVERVRSYRRSWKRAFKHFDLSLLVRNLLAGFDSYYPALSKVPVKSRIEQNIRIYGDELQVEILILNLLRNACEACALTPTADIEVSVERRGNNVVVGIADTGPLSSREELARMTTSFRESSKANGLGLGLLIVRGIVEQHKAELKLDLNGSHGLSAQVVFSWKVNE